MNFKNGLDKVKDFGKKHWKELLAGGAVVGGTIAAISIGKKYTPPMPIKELTDSNTDWWKEEMKRIAELDWQVGQMTSLWDEGEFTEAIVNNVKVSDLGRFGEELKKIEGLTDESVIGAVIDITKEVTEG